MRPLDIVVNHESPNSQKHGTPFLWMNKPCKMCVWPCCCRPELLVYNIEGGANNMIGRLEMPC